MQTYSLFFDAVEQGDLVFVRLDGIIDEGNGLAGRLAELSGRKILLNMAKVERINSCGVRDWVRWIEALEGNQNGIFLVQCNPVVVAQINMVRNFCGARAHVVSFQAPYFCSHCQKEHRETVVTSTVGAAARPPEAVCETCGEVMEFDDLPESYFSFTRDHGQRPMDPDVHRSMNKFEDAQLATKVAALKQIFQSTTPGTMPGGTPVSKSPIARPPEPFHKAGSKVDAGVKLSAEPKGTDRGGKKP